MAQYPLKNKTKQNKTKQNKTNKKQKKKNKTKNKQTNKQTNKNQFFKTFTHAKLTLCLQWVHLMTNK